MFENIIEQPAVSLIKNDITGGTLAQSMLFYGSQDTGKGSAALELARIQSCEKDSSQQAAWKCSCPSCERHRYLQSDDLLILGKRNFSAEIAAFCSVFRHNPSQSTKLLFYRSLRKLQIRFSPFITEDDAKISKLSAQLQSFDEKLNDFLNLNPGEESSVTEKICQSILKEAKTLDEDGIGRNIPVSHIRRAAYWCRLAPGGKRKTLIIENADNTRDEAANSLLKLLEEPPAAVSIILTAKRRESIIPTILSRLRPYRFLNRSTESEKEVLRRIFLSPGFNAENIMHNSLITSYLDTFQPAGIEKMHPVAEWFISQDYSGNNPQIVKTLLAKSNNFENDSFPQFLKLCMELMSKNLRKAEDPGYIVYYDLFKKYANEAVTAVDVLNQNVTIALEALLFKLKSRMNKQYA